MFITTKKAQRLVQQVVAHHAPRILQDLGFTGNTDGILDRIRVVAHPKTVVDDHEAFFKHRQLGNLFLSEVWYEEGSGSIEINADSYFYMKEKGKYIELKPLRWFTSNKRFKAYYINVLAHEMRHFWQYYTGIVYRKSVFIGGHNTLPYNMRWEEKDANQFADDYAKMVYEKSK